MEQINYLLKLLPKRPLSLICGKLLGDGSLTIEEKRKPRFRFQHCIEDKEWCEYCYISLKEYLPMAQPKYKFTVDPRLKNGFSESFVVQSRTAEILSLLKEIWYQDRKKIIPIELINQTLNEELLAWWYQDDGCFISDNGIPRKIILSTDSFTEIENKTISKILNDKFSLHFSLDKQNRLCLYNQPQIHLFFHLIASYIHPSMKRKKLENKQIDINSIPDHKRTTIYLPVSINIQRPTEEIHNMINQLNYEDVMTSILNLPIQDAHKETKGYQIVLHKDQLIKLCSIKSQTGFCFSKIVQIGYLHSQKSTTKR